MQVITAPSKDIYNKEGQLGNKLCLFLAGSIDSGKAVDWQQQAIKDLEGTDGFIFNPRRTDWDFGWEQTPNWKNSEHNKIFSEQVKWELDAMERSNYIVMHFEPNTKSNISMLELGIHSKNASKLIVHCPEGFWRKPRIDSVCDYYNIPQVFELKDAINYIKTMAKSCNFGNIP